MIDLKDRRPNEVITWITDYVGCVLKPVKKADKWSLVVKDGKDRRRDRETITIFSHGERWLKVRITTPSKDYDFHHHALKQVADLLAYYRMDYKIRLAELAVDTTDQHAGQWLKRCGVMPWATTNPRWTDRPGKPLKIGHNPVKDGGQYDNPGTSPRQICAYVREISQQQTYRYEIRLSEPALRRTGIRDLEDFFRLAGSLPGKLCRIWEPNATKINEPPKKGRKGIRSSLFPGQRWMLEYAAASMRSLAFIDQAIREIPGATRRQIIGAFISQKPFPRVKADVPSVTNHYSLYTSWWDIRALEVKRIFSDL